LKLKFNLIVKGGRKMLANKKVFVLGERDGVSAPAIEECVKAIGAEVIYKDTQCFV
jgi:betaine reductase